VRRIEQCLITRSALINFRLCSHASGAPTRTGVADFEGGESDLRHAAPADGEYAGWVAPGRNRIPEHLDRRSPGDDLPELRHYERRPCRLGQPQAPLHRPPVKRWIRAITSSYFFGRRSPLGQADNHRADHGFRVQLVSTCLWTVRSGGVRGQRRADRRSEGGLTSGLPGPTVRQVGFFTTGRAQSATMEEVCYGGV
jgi:hypothetical protein